MSSVKIRKIAVWVIVGFIVYAIFTDPTKAGTIVHDIWSLLETGVERLGQFFHSILNR